MGVLQGSFELASDIVFAALHFLNYGLVILAGGGLLKIHERTLDCC